MISLQRLIFPILFISISVIGSTGALAEELTSQSSNIFKFQQKLALKGNVKAQYKLAMMYESGAGVDKDLEQAEHWYTKASEAGDKAAADRSVYLKVKQRGYNSTTDASWLSGIKAGANDNNAEAIYLLGQMYREGHGVDKDLNKSLELLTTVNILGTANVDKQIAAIMDEIDAEKAAQLRIKKQRKMDHARAKQEQEVQVANQLADQQAEKELKAKNEELIKAEKRRRYEAVMLQLKLEQEKIDGQQAEVTGVDSVAMDDEI